MGRALWLPGVLRAAGLTVHEQPGWQTRGADTFDPHGIIVHATAGRLSVDSDIRVLLTGSETAPPPIAQLFLARTGEWWVIASGRCNHALTGWAGPLKGFGNTRLLGVEAANDNRGEPWPTAQYASYVRGVAAICRHLRWTTARVAGHKEHQPAGYGRPSTKTDPTFDMGTFRAAVTRTLSGATPTEEEYDMPLRDDPDFRALIWRMVDGVINLRDTYDNHAGNAAEPSELARVLRRLEAAAAADQARDTATHAAVTALADVIRAGGGSVDTAAIVAAINDRAAVAAEQVQHLATRVAELQAELAATRAAAEANLSAAERETLAGG